MDRSLQRYFITAVLLITTLVGAAQSDITVQLDSTGRKVVQMTPEKFAYYYQVEKNLRAIEDSLPHLAASIEKEREQTAVAEATLEQQVALAKRMAEIEAQGREDCMEVATTLEIDNLYLDSALKKEKKKKWLHRGVGAGGTVLLMILLNAATP